MRGLERRGGQRERLVSAADQQSVAEGAPVVPHLRLRPDLCLPTTSTSSQTGGSAADISRRRTVLLIGVREREDKDKEPVEEVVA